MIKFEFQFSKAIPQETIQSIYDSCLYEMPFGLENAKGKVIMFYPSVLGVDYGGNTKQVCADKEAFENVISMSLYRYTKFKGTLKDIDDRERQAKLLITFPQVSTIP